MLRCLVILLVILLVMSLASSSESVEFKLKIQEIHDADTIVADIYVELDDMVLHNQTIRFADIDCWETTKRRASVKVTAAEIEKGKKAKTDLEKLFSSAMVITAEPSGTGRDVYGRRLMILRYDGKLVSEYLRDSGHERR